MIECHIVQNRILIFLLMWVRYICIFLNKNRTFDKNFNFYLFFFNKALKFHIKMYTNNNKNNRLEPRQMNGKEEEHIGMEGWESRWHI